MQMRLTLRLNKLVPYILSVLQCLLPTVRRQKEGREFKGRMFGFSFLAYVSMYERKGTMPYLLLPAVVGGSEHKDLSASTFTEVVTKRR